MDEYHEKENPEIFGGCTGKVPNPGSCSEAQKNYIEKPTFFNSEGGIKLIRKSGTCWGEIPSLRNQNEQRQRKR